MKRIAPLLSLLFLCITPMVFGQLSAKDSARMLKEEKKTAAITKKIEEQKIQLLQLETKAESLKIEAEKKAEIAKVSTSDNEKVAGKLNDDIHDKKNARKAKRAAKKATDDAKSSRKSKQSFEKATDDIASLKKKIARNEKDLAKLQSNPKKQVITKQD